MTPRIAIRITGKPVGRLLVGNRAGLLELAAQLERIANAPPGADTGRFSRLPYYDDLSVLRCRKNRGGMIDALVGVLVDEAIDEPDEEVVIPAKQSISLRALTAFVWITLLLVFLLGTKELIRLLMIAVTRFLS